MTRRLFYAMLGTETNTFSPLPSGWQAWHAGTLRRRREHDPTVNRMHIAYAPLFAALDERGWTLVPGLQAFAAPAGITPRAVWESLRDELLEDLAHAGEIDAVMLFLHGAMVAEGCDDCEGDLLARVRAHVGRHVPVGAVLDLHCHVSEAMLARADALVGFKHYPHTDAYERLLDLFRILADTREGKVRPVTACARVRMLGFFHTTREPMASFVDGLYALEREPGVLNAWLAHGFPYADVPDLAVAAIVVTDGDRARADALARDLRDAFFALRHDVVPDFVGLDQALDAAPADSLADSLAEPRGPVILADTADNTGGGAPGDSTFALSALLARDVSSAALGPLYDPGSVDVCHDAGAGAQIRLRIGGKLARESGPPVDVDCTVLAVAERVVQTLNGGPSELGRAAAVRIGAGIDVVLTAKRVQAGSPELFTRLGIEPRAKRVLVLKSAQHFHAGFAPLSSRVLYVGGPGALPGRLQDVPYRRIRAARYWPNTEQPDFDD
jgi:microcystin degradation protein MlrC